ncbi:MAG: DegV family protein [Anaerolineales bacterium]|nr:DegV family protein [Anaerolineales bacterium]
MNSTACVHVVTDTGCSFRPGDPAVAENQIDLIPLQLSILEDGQWKTKQETDIAPGQFYTIMKCMLAEQGELPKTSGLNPGLAREMYLKLFQRDKVESVYSVHITGAHSQAWGSAHLGAEQACEEMGEDLPIIVADSRQLTIGQWWVAKHAARIAKMGASLKQVAEEAAQLLPKIQVLAVLDNFENLKRGGRADQIKGHLASLMSALTIHPILGFRDGKLDIFGRARNAIKARGKMFEIALDRGNLANLAVIHTNALEMATEARDTLARAYKGFIEIVDAGPALAVHAGERAVGVVSQVK